MAVIKQACPKCGQRVSGDESFYGTSVECPICSSKIFFPDPDGPKKEVPSKKESPSSSSSSSGWETSKSPPPLEDALDDYHDEDNFDDLRPKARTKAAPVQTNSAGVPTTYAEPPSATLSIISMVFGILNAVTFCIPAIVLAPAAIICGHIALIKGKFSPIQPAPGRGMAITGLILGYIGLAVMLIALILTVTGAVDFLKFLERNGGAGAG